MSPSASWNICNGSALCLENVVKILFSIEIFICFVVRISGNRPPQGFYWKKKQLGCKHLRKVACSFTLHLCKFPFRIEFFSMPSKTFSETFFYFSAVEGLRMFLLQGINYSISEKWLWSEALHKSLKDQFLPALSLVFFLQARRKKTLAGEN